jgi:hypothetical protein
VLSLALPPAQFFAGLDWAAEIHAVCVMDAAGNVVAQFTIKHTPDGITGLLRRLATLAAPADVQVGIERPTGRPAVWSICRWPSPTPTTPVRCGP